MNERIRHTDSWFWLTVPIALLLTIAAGGGLFISSLYRDTPSVVAQAVAQDLVSLAVVLPTLIVAAVLASRGSLRARLVWLGALAYVVYTYVVFAFDIRFNALFLVYVALLGCALYALIGGFVTADVEGIKACFTDDTPVKAISIYLGVFGVLFYVLWLSEIVPALLTGAIPESIQEDGTPTNGVHVVDMAWILPALGITAISLWRKQALGYTLAGAILAYLVLLILAILAMAVLVGEGQPISVPAAVLFGALFACSLGLLLWYLKGVKSPGIASGTPLPARGA